jgi:uncharacterized repeat protein (TIGR03847 family)
LAERLSILCKQVSKEDVTLVVERVERDDAPLESPVDKDFVIGAISIAWDDEVKKVSVELFSTKEIEVEDEVADITLNLTLGQATAFITRTTAVVNAGRVPCPFCAIPIDPRGHLCPRANGYRR